MQQIILHKEMKDCLLLLPNHSFGNDDKATIAFKVKTIAIGVDTTKQGDRSRVQYKDRKNFPPSGIDRAVSSDIKHRGFSVITTSGHSIESWTQRPGSGSQHLQQCAILVNKSTNK